MAIADALIFYTDDEIKNFKIDRFALSKKRYITALNNGIDSIPVKKFRKKYISNKRLNELLFIGSLTKKANIRICLNALSLLKNQNIILHIVGDGEQREMLYLLSKKLSLDKFVIWHGSIINEKKIAKIANRCKFFLYPGAVGLSLIHAMAYGLPALVHEQRDKHMPEIAAFKRGKTGLVFKYNNMHSLVFKIKKMLSNNLNNDLFSQNAIRILDTNYNTAVMADRFISLIKQIKKYNID
jgi:glycosyltransferase involved in cell wall biosynthesis